MMKLTFSLERDTLASAKALTEKGSRPRENLMELKMAMMAKAWLNTNTSTPGVAEYPRGLSMTVPLHLIHLAAGFIQSDIQTVHIESIVEA